MKRHRKNEFGKRKLFDTSVYPHLGGLQKTKDNANGQKKRCCISNLNVTKG